MDIPTPESLASKVSLRDEIDFKNGLKAVVDSINNFWDGTEIAVELPKTTSRVRYRIIRELNKYGWNATDFNNVLTIKATQK